MPEFKSLIAKVPASQWKEELEKTSSRYHLTAAWVAVIFDPVFAITDFINIPNGWPSLLIFRICVSLITISTILVRRKWVFSSFIVALVPFSLISVQNAYAYRFINNSGLLGQNLNYMALLVGAAMFVLWHWRYSVFMIVGSALVTILFIYNNPQLTFDGFFLNGGLLLAATSVFMIVLIRTRYNLSLREIKARLALRASNLEIQSQAAEIKRINENLEQLVKERTLSLEKKNKALEEYAFINAHNLRGPVASILGLIDLLTKMSLSKEADEVNNHLKESAQKLDSIVSKITRVIEKEDE